MQHAVWEQLVALVAALTPAQGRWAYWLLGCRLLTALDQRPNGNTAERKPDEMPLRLLVDSLNQCLLVGGLRKSLAGGAAFLPVNPQLRTSSSAQANFRLCAKTCREHVQQSTGQNARKRTNGGHGCHVARNIYYWRRSIVSGESASPLSINRNS